MCVFSRVFALAGGCREDEDPEYKPLRMPFKDDLDDFTNSPLDEKDEGADGEAEGARGVPLGALV